MTEGRSQQRGPVISSSGARIWLFHRLGLKILEETTNESPDCIYKLDIFWLNAHIFPQLSHAYLTVPLFYPTICQWYSYKVRKCWTPLRHFLDHTFVTGIIQLLPSRLWEWGKISAGWQDWKPWLGSLIKDYLENLCGSWMVQHLRPCVATGNEATLLHLFFSGS